MDVEFERLATLAHVVILGIFHPTPLAHAIPRADPTGHISAVVVNFLDQLVRQLRDLLEVFAFPIAFDQPVNFVIGHKGKAVGYRLGRQTRLEFAISIVAICLVFLVGVIRVVGFPEARVHLHGGVQRAQHHLVLFLTDFFPSRRAFHHFHL